MCVVFTIASNTSLINWRLPRSVGVGVYTLTPSVRGAQNREVRNYFRGVQDEISSGCGLLL